VVVGRARGIQTASANTKARSASATKRDDQRRGKRETAESGKTAYTVLAADVFGLGD
jgi:hypothetical protein